MLRNKGITQRNSSIELLRIISIIFIVMMHVSSLMVWEDASLTNRLIVGVLNSIGNIGVSCFMLISGYYGVKFKMHKFLNLVLLTTVYCTIVAVFRFGLQPMPIIKAVLTIPSYSLWFIVCYLILMLLSPYLNQFATTLSQRDYRKMIIILVIVLSVIPTIFNGGFNGVVLRQGGKNLVYILFLYILGRYIRLHYDKIFNKWCLWSTHIICSILILSLNILGTLLFHKRCVIFRLDCCPLMLLSAVSIFYLFKSWNFYNHLINYVASSVFAFYIISNIYHYLDSAYIHLKDYSPYISFWQYLCLLVCASWMISLLIDKTLGNILNYILIWSENKLRPIVTNCRIYKRIMR